MNRRVLIVANPHRVETVLAARAAREALTARGIVTLDSADGGRIDGVIVLGGDGTMLRAAREARGSGAALLGVNMGHVGFLAEFERDKVSHAVERLAEGDYEVDERSTVDVTVLNPDGSSESGWALNEATVERAELLRSLDVAVEVDGRPLSSFGCDGVVVASPTGSTAHAFSAGGPVVWPDVDALLMVPLAAHALFARPLVLGPTARLAIELLERSGTEGAVVLDGAQTIPVVRGARIEFRRGDEPVRLARTSEAPFTERLVRKFGLNTEGWRGTEPGARG